jgi:hypothetical protein
MENDLREIVRLAPGSKDDLLKQILHAKNTDARAVRSAHVAIHPRPGHGALYRLLCDLDRSDQRLWPLAETIGCTPEETAIIAQIVAPQLAGMTPGNILRRHKLAE